VIVVADTSPINYLVQIACDSLLPDLYQRVLIPAAVLDELRSSFLSRVSQTLAINLAGLDRYQEDIFQL
jgi:predicted nucleic acid-binding protein